MRKQIQARGLLVLLAILFTVFCFKKVNACLCGSTTILRSANLKTPTKFKETCSYRLKATNRNVCQVKLEFIQLSLAQPTVNNTGAYKCEFDEFEANGMRLCGENSGQHIFVPYSSSRVININIRLANNRTALPTPSWKIKFTQIDCRSQSIDVPPYGCSQYFSAPSGVIESFNFNNGLGPYIGNTEYAICVYKPEPNSRVVLTANRFTLGYAENNNYGLDSDCYTSIPTPLRSEDHLYVPGAELQTSPQRANRFCGTSLMQNTIQSNVSGPFVMYFHSDDIYEGPEKPEIGFSIKYNVF